MEEKELLDDGDDDGDGTTWGIFRCAVNVRQGILYASF